MTKIWPLLLALCTPLPAWASAADAVQLAAADAAKLGPVSAQSARYFWISSGTPGERLTTWQIVSGLVHGQSREKPIIPPYLILSTGELKFAAAMQAADWAKAVLIRVDLYWYRWSRKVFDKLGEQDHIFHVLLSEPTARDGATGKPILFRDGKWIFSDNPTTVQALSPTLVETVAGAAALATLVNLTQARCPILEAHNFIWQIAIAEARVVGYYGLLEIADEATFDRAIGYDPKADVDPAFLEELLAAVSSTDSGVSIRNRRIARRNKFGEGARWATFDNAVNKKNRNPIRFPNGTFVFAATEVLGNLANKFVAQGLFTGPVDAKGNPQKAGVRQDTAPDFVGRDSRTHNNDGRIHVGMCFRCHVNGGLMDIKDWFRNMQPAGLGLQVPWDKKLLEVQSRYVERLEPYLDRDRQLYAAALWEACGLKPDEFARKFARIYEQYDDGVTLERAAADCNVTPADLQAKLGLFLRATGYQDTVLAELLKPDGRRSKISTEDWLETKNLCDLTIRGLKSWPADVRNKVVKLGEAK